MEGKYVKIFGIENYTIKYFSLILKTFFLNTDLPINFRDLIKCQIKYFLRIESLLLVQLFFCIWRAQFSAQTGKISLIAVLIVI